MTSPDTAATTIEIKRIEIESIAREGSPQCDIWYDTVAWAAHVTTMEGVLV